MFSHPSKLDLIANAQRQALPVALDVVALDDPQRLLGRVAQREARPPGAARTHPGRYPRTMVLLAQAVRQADVAYLYDAAEVRAGGPQLVAVRSGQQHAGGCPSACLGAGHAGCPAPMIGAAGAMSGLLLN